MRRVARLLTILVGLAALFVTPFANVEAQTPSQAITLSPASTKLSADAGSSASDSLEVINGGNDSYKVNLSVSPYHVTGEQYSPQFSQLPGTVDASEWVKLNTTEATLEGLKVLSVNYTVEVPANTAPGGYYAVIFAETDQIDASDGGVVPHNRVGNILYITVNGDVETAGDVSGDTLPFFSFSPSIPLGVKVSNTGGVHFETKTSFTVTDFSGKQVFKSDIERIVLPSTVRDISAAWESTTPIGLYTIQRQATVGTETVTLDEQKVLIVSPWFLTCVVIFLGSIIALFILQLRQRKRRK